MARKNEKPEDLLDVAQVAARLTVSPSTVYRLIHEGTLPAARFGVRHGVRVRAGDVDRFEKGRKE
ncbi:MAG: DNA-binding protein [Deltaproteobacteria bacterium]|nr:DNA-binding protein [Deltaproteobacteria bacterium]